MERTSIVEQNVGLNSATSCVAGQKAFCPATPRAATGATMNKLTDVDWVWAGSRPSISFIADCNAAHCMNECSRRSQLRCGHSDSLLLPLPC